MSILIIVAIVLSCWSLIAIVNLIVDVRRVYNIADKNRDEISKIETRLFDDDEIATMRCSILSSIDILNDALIRDIELLSMQQINDIERELSDLKYARRKIDKMYEGVNK